jgi:hypothetical protein
MKTFKQFLKEQEENHPMIDVDGEQKHRNNSEGRPIHHTDEGIRNFHRWFEGSKATDEHGRPSVMYHASTYGDIHEFNTHGGAFGKAGYGSYFSNKHGSNMFADYGQKFQMDRSAQGDEKKTNITPVYLKMNNPYHAAHVDDLKPGTHKHSGQSFGVTAKYQKNTPSEKGPLEQKGHDGIMTNETTAAKVHKTQGLKILDRNDPKATKFPVHVVFHPNQIKSATGNNGEFSPKSNKITEGYLYH